MSHVGCAGDFAPDRLINDPFGRRVHVRFGVTVPNFGEYFHPRTLASLAHDAEAAGWDGFFVWDHALYDSFSAVDPWVALAAVAINTERIRIGPMVTPLPRRSPLK